MMPRYAPSLAGSAPRHNPNAGAREQRGLDADAGPMMRRRAPSKRLQRIVGPARDTRTDDRNPRLSARPSRPRRGWRPLAHAPVGRAAPLRAQPRRLCARPAPARGLHGRVPGRAPEPCHHRRADRGRRPRLHGAPAPGARSATARCCASLPACARSSVSASARGLAKTSAFASVRAPKLPRSLPKPLSPGPRLRGRRRRRISSARRGRPGRSRATPPSWRCSTAPGCVSRRRWGSPAGRRAGRRHRGDHGRSARAARCARCQSSRRCARRSKPISPPAPIELPAEGPLFIGVRQGPLSPRLIQLAVERLRGALGPARFGDAACAAPFVRDAPAVARRRPAHDPGAAGSIRSLIDDADLHRGRRGAAGRKLPRQPSPGAIGEPA